MNVSEFDFELPPELIAQEPPPARGTSRLLVLARGTGAVSHHRIDELPALLDPGDLLVVNDTRVFPARPLGPRCPSSRAGNTRVSLTTSRSPGSSSAGSSSIRWCDTAPVPRASTSSRDVPRAGGGSCAISSGGSSKSNSETFMKKAKQRPGEVQGRTKR